MTGTYLFGRHLYLARSKVHKSLGTPKMLSESNVAGLILVGKSELWTGYVFHNLLLPRRHFNVINAMFPTRRWWRWINNPQYATIVASKWKPFYDYCMMKGVSQVGLVLCADIKTTSPGLHLTFPSLCCTNKRWCASHYVDMLETNRSFSKNSQMMGLGSSHRHTSEWSKHLTSQTLG